MPHPQALTPEPCLLELFLPLFRISSQNAVMKALTPSRTELRWMAVAIPSLFAVHWAVTALGPRLLAMLPYSLRAVLHLL